MGQSLPSSVTPSVSKTLTTDRIPITQRFLLSLGIETGWEILENTPWLIQMYRKQALAVGYSGDSIINSVFDSVAMALGFVLAWRLPVWITIVLAVAMESFVGYFIDDNLALNILNSVHCPSSEFLRHLASPTKGGSGPSVFDIKRPARGAASGDLR